jgi:hypothetical protein
LIEVVRAPQNLTYRSPFILRANNFDQWFSNCGLSREKVEQVRKLTYPQGDLLFFADLPAFTELSTPAENLCLVRSLWRVSTFIMSVRVTPGMDSESLLNYWAKGGRAYSYKPLVDSMARLGNGTAINISYFLPPFARLRLYTFPQPEEPHTMREDCFWTAMNFFNDQPDDRYFNPEATIRAINSDYVRVKEGDREFGDVLLLLSKESQALHMCVYIADDVVFTKNGFNVMQPYVLMKLDEMLAWYANEKPFNVVTYRRRALAHTGAAGLSMTRQNQ